MIEIAYSSHVRQRLDWYAGSKLAVLCIHAGGWVGGDKRDYANLAPYYIDAFTAKGWAVASMNYRFSSDAPWPAQLQDAQAALDALKVLAGAPIVIFAESSGGQIGLELLGARRESIEALAALYPVTDLAQIAAESTAVPNPWPAWRDALLPQGGYANASPADHPQPSSGPVLLLHGDADTLVPVAQSQRYATAARAAGNDCFVVPLIGAAHGAPVFHEPVYVDLVVGFFERFAWR